MSRSETVAGGGSEVRLEVRLLGAFEVIADGRRLRAFDSVRMQRALAMVAIRRDLEHRSRLAFELWPDSSERQARTNLRKLIHDVRHALPDVEAFIHIDTEVVRWISNGPSSVDVVRFREALAVGDVELATHLYGGDFLPACYDDWVLEERRKLRSKARGAFQQLTEQAAESGDHDAVVRAAQGLVDLVPTDEGAARVQIEAHLAGGDRAAAIRAYHRYAEALERELRLRPQEGIRALYESVRDSAQTSDGDDRSGAASTDSPFVGRARPGSAAGFRPCPA
jgi:DNA-binding SARP family transcriptional activator